MLKITKKSVVKLLDVLQSIVEDSSKGNNNVFVVSQRKSGMYDIELIKNQTVLNRPDVLILGNTVLDYMISVLDSLDRYTVDVDQLKRQLERVVTEDVINLGLRVENRRIVDLN